MSNHHRMFWIETGLIAAGMLSGMGCMADQAPPVSNATGTATRADLISMHLRLRDGQGTCSVTAQDKEGGVKEHLLQLPWPCAFHLDTAGQVRLLKSAGWTYLLVESQVGKEAPLNPAEPGACKTRLQSIRVKAKRIEMSPHKDCVASTPPFQWDNFVFKALFD